MSVTLNNWCQYLTKATSNKPTSPIWICETRRNGSERRIEILSKIQFDNFFQEHSRWNSSRKKLSIKEIVSISQKFISTISTKFKPSEIPENLETNLRIKKIITTANIFSSHPEKAVIAALGQIETEGKGFTKALQIIPTSLGKIAKRSAGKRLAEKSNSIWGKINWYIWSWFFDNRSTITKIKNRITEVKVSTPPLAYIYQVAQVAIRDRIHVNMQYFEEEIGIKKAKRNDFSNEATVEKFNTPEKIKKLWLTQYSVNHYRSKVSRQADTFRKRIGAMMKVWTAINENERAHNKNERAHNENERAHNENERAQYPDNMD